MLFRSLKREQRAIDASEFNKAIFNDPTPTHAGVKVDQDTALRLISVYACVRLISESVAALPANLYRKKDEDRIEVPSPRWLTNPNPEQNWFELVERTLTSLNLDGNAYIAITARDRNGFPAELWTLHPGDVEPKRDDANNLYYLWGGTERLSRFDSSNPGGTVLHIKAFSNGGDRGLSPIEVARQAIGLGLVTEQHGARFFGHGSNPSGVIEVPKLLTDELAKSLKKNWIKQHGGADKAQMPGVLSGGAQWKPISIPHDSAQFLETRKFQVGEIARLFRVPPHMIADVEKESSWGKGIEQQGIGFVVYTLTPWLVRLEHAFNQLSPRGQFIKWNVNGLLRGDIRTRFAAYATGIQNGFLNRNEVRHLEEMNSEEGLDDFLEPLNMTDPTNTGEPSPGVITDQTEND